ncbi:hypothetical protein HG536_0F02050 [Torulaspora globosa]|uniref:Protein BTN n=1 Tax=Torulaspora globosa TaxID=48254 RepID=A0A7G3ZK44_9SACH|nr:uncharacterized protein HG536_0F02050 [Torulaspora globosa]QLL33880.1 hypothetical protein HG536_0F02050 [Torulaspora globosa]
MVLSNRQVYICFWIFGLVNNVLYVVILSAAVDIVGPSLPKSLVLLLDILPAFVIKLVAPFFVHKLRYDHRILCLIVFSCLGMLLVSCGSLRVCLAGVALASLSSGFGEVTFLQLTHYYQEVSLNGWSSGTGGAGLFGSGIYMLFTSLLEIPVTVSLLSFSVLPLGFLLYYKLGVGQEEVSDSAVPFLNNDPEEINALTLAPPTGVSSVVKQNLLIDLRANMYDTCQKLKELIEPFMLPLTTVYLFEYMINQAVAPTLLFPLGQKHVPFFFRKYRDIYVTYGTLYQLGVFISRSTAHLVRMKRLYLLSSLQFLNLLLVMLQSWYYIVQSPWPIMFLVFYEGFLGGAAYVNTFLNILEEVENKKREFALGSVSIADSFGVLVAAFIGLRLEPFLCGHQIADGRPWCSME